MVRITSFASLLCLAFMLCALTLRGVSSQQGGVRRITSTTEEGINLNPSLSGDGGRIAFESTEDVARAGGGSHFRAIRADLTTEPPNFVQMGGARAVAPALSQDGSRIAFASTDNPVGTNRDGNSEIFLYDGTTLRQLTETSPGSLIDRTRNGNFRPSISDDGRFIAFASNRDLVPGHNPDANLEVFVYDALAQAFTQLTSSTGTVGASDAKISGGGSRVAYIRDTGATASAQRDLVLQERVGGATLLAAANVSGLAFGYGRAISDDGTRLVYAAETATPNSTQVFLFDGRSLNQIRPVTFLGARAADVPLQPTISGDGLRIAFATRRTVLPEDGGSSVDLYTFDIPTGQFARVTPTPQSTTEAQATPTAEVVSSLSDDGALIAFNFPRLLSGPVTFPESGNNSEIYLARTTARAPFANLTVLNGASLGHEPSSTKAVAPNSIAVGLGGALATTTEQSERQADGSFPRSVGGTTVTVNGRRAQIFFASPAQVNFLVPPETETGTAEVVVTASDGFQTRGTVTVMRAAPGLFTYSGDGRGEGVILDADSLTPGPFDPTNGRRRLIVWATGARGAKQVVVTIGGRIVTVEAVVDATRLPGLDEVHLLLPADLRGAGKVSLFIGADGRDSNPVDIHITGEAKREVLINEVLADPPEGVGGDANRDGVRDNLQDEFVEIVNVTGGDGLSAKDIDLSNFELLSRGGGGSQDMLRHHFAPGTILPAGAAIVVFGGGGPEVSSSNQAFGGAQVVKASTGSLSLLNSGGVITLREPSGAVAGLFSYGGNTNLKADANQSLTRSPDITGPFTGHLSAQGSDGRAYSPGTQVNGQPFLSPAITRIELAPASASVFVGQARQFTATAYDAAGNPMSGVIFIWQTSDARVAAVDTTGLVTAVTEGTAELRAFARGMQSAPAQVTVSPVERILTRIEVTPGSASTPVSGTQQFTARALDQFDQQITGLPFAWSSSDTNIATIDPVTALATAASQGSVAITALAQNIRGTATLNVTAPTVVINEVLADPPGGPDGDANHDGTRDTSDDEFIELVNTTGSAINISGWTIKTLATGATEITRHTFATGTSLPANEAIVVFGGGGPGVNSDHPAFGCAQVVKASAASGLSLTNTGLRIILSDASGKFVSQFTYGGTTGLGGDQNQSLTRSPDATGLYIEHTRASGSAGRKFSPGTRVDGKPFAACPPRLTGLSISPTSSDLVVGQPAQFTAQASDQFGNPMVGAAITFASDNTSVATVDSVTMDAATGTATAIVTGRAAGEATIRATASVGTGTVTSAPAMLTVAQAVNAGQLLISEFRTRGPAGASDEFIEIYNPTASSVPIGGLKLRASNNAGVTSDRVTITTGTTLGSGCHYLLANSSYSGSATPNQTFGTGISDDGGIAITRADGTTIIDQVGMSNGSAYKEGATLAPLALNLDQGYERKPGGAAGNGTDSNNNAADFFLNSSTSNPQNSSSGCLDLSAPAITIKDARVTEGSGATVTASFTVTLSASSARTVNVSYATSSQSPATADAATDYQSSSATLAFNPGETSKSLSVQINGDTLVEPDEIFFVNLSGAVNATIYDAQGTGTIENDDTANLVISQIYGGGNNAGATYRNDFIEIFNRGTTTVDFAVTPYSVQYASASAAASGSFGTNKTNLSTGTIAPGRYFLVQEAGGTTNGAALPAPDATGSIAMAATAGKVALVAGTTPLPASLCPDDDGSPPYNPSNTLIADFLGYGDFASTAGHCYEGPGPAPAASNTTADFRKAGGCTDTGNNAADFLALTPSPRNSRSPVNDCRGVAPPTLSISDTTVTEGNSGTVTATFTVSLSSPASGADVTFDIVTQDNTATVADSDYVARGLTNQVIPAGQQTFTFDVTVNSDTKVEPDETFFVNVANLSGAIVSDSQGVGTIQHDDLPSLSVNDVTRMEGDAGTTIFSFIVSLSAPAPAPITFDIATTDLSAQDGTPMGEDKDYVARSLTRQTISTGQQAYTFDVTVNGDTGIEPDESFIAEVTSLSGANSLDAQGLGTIQNDDAQPVLSINDVTASEGHSGTTTFAFTVSLSEPAKKDGVTFDIATQDSTATVAGNDYTARSLTSQSIPEGNQTYTFNVAVTGDTVFEPNETFFINVTNVTGATVADGQGVGTITNDDAQPTITIADAARIEGNAGTSPLTFTVTLNGTSQTAVTFNYDTADASATASDADYDSTSGTLRLAPGESSKTFTVTIHGDLNAEGDEMFLVNLSGASGATISDNQARGTIFLDDPLSVASLNTTYSENFNILAQGGVSSATPPAWTRAETGSSANSTYSANNGSSTMGDSYSYGSVGSSDRAFGGLRTGSLVPIIGAFYRNDTGFTINRLQIAYTGEQWRLGAASRTDRLDFQYSTSATSLTTGIWSDVNALDFTTPNSTATGAKDGNNVANRTALSSTITGLNIAPGATFWVRWTDADASGSDDGLAVDDFSLTAGINTPALTIDDVSQAEGSLGTTTCTFTVSLSSVAGPGGVSFDISTADNTATSADNDYVARSLTNQVIPAGQQTFTFDVTVNSDTKVEPDETFFVNVTNLSGATLSDGQGVGTITNDDTFIASADLSVTKTDAPDPVAIGNDTTYTMTVTNGGPDAASNAVLADTVPTNTAFRSITAPAGWSCLTQPAVGGTGPISCTNSSFAVGSSVFTLVVRVGAAVADGTTISNTASVSSGTFDPNSGNNSVTQQTTVSRPNLVISQVYGAGGNSGATYQNDFVEIFNRGTTTVNFAATNYSIQYTNATGNFGGTTPSVKFDITSGTIAPGQYFLIKLAGGANGMALPVPDATGSIIMAATAGKVALVLGTTALAATACPKETTIVDFVGYGTTASCFEGTGPAPAPSATNADIRGGTAGTGCLDNNNNATDFAAAPVNPHHTGSPRHGCP